MSDASSAKTRGPSAFATTRWSVVVRAGDAGNAGARQALEELCGVYWKPLYVFARRRGLGPADAEDLTQAFFADLLERQALRHADANRGRFRTFLLTAFENFRCVQRVRARSLRRGGRCEFLSLDAVRGAESGLEAESASTESPEKLFDRNWARAVLDATLAEVRKEYAVLGKAELFDALKGALWGGRGETPLADVARRLGSTEGAIKVAAHRLRHRYAGRLREEVAKTLVNPDDVEDEMRFLMAALR